MITWFLEELPLIITIFVSLLFFLDIFIPNPRKHGKWIGIIVFELFEHILVPVLFLMTGILFPFEYLGWILLIIILVFVYVFIGKVVGNAKEIRDWLKVSWLFVIYMFFLYLYPSLVILFQTYTHLSGIYFLIFTMLGSYFLSRYLKQRMDK